MLFNRTRGLWLFFVVLVLVSCSQRDKMEIEKSASAFDIKQGEASVLQANQNFIKSYKAGDSVAVSQAFTTNAKLMMANQPPIKGRAAIGQYFAGMIQSGDKNVELNTVKIWGDSTILVEEGTYLLLNKKGNQADKGEYIALWQRESGNWKIYRDMWTSSIPQSVLKISDSTMIKP